MFFIFHAFRFCHGSAVRVSACVRASPCECSAVSQPFRAPPTFPPPLISLCRDTDQASSGVCFVALLSAHTRSWSRSQGGREGGRGWERGENACTPNLKSASLKLPRAHPCLGSAAPILSIAHMPLHYPINNDIINDKLLVSSIAPSFSPLPHSTSLSIHNITQVVG